MKRFATAAGLILAGMSAAQATNLSMVDLRQVAPALEIYTRDRVHGEVWKRPDLNMRDRSI
jgi:4-carboxymuconolactone decarboxylase